jgi:3-hydroxybutyryl-CoA dehydrogenase
LKQIHKIGVVGEGKMGSSVFLYLNGFDFTLAWLCSGEAARDSALKTFRKKTRFLYQSGVLSEEQYHSKTEKTVVTFSIEELQDCDLIIEAITENIDSKKTLFAALDKNVNPDCIITSNSSSILPSEFNLPASRTDKFAGLHFFFPVPVKNCVELISSSKTSVDTIDSLRNFLIQINKTPFHQSEANAFVLNRLLLDFQAGAYQIFLEGKLSVVEIDDLVKKYLFPVGVFEFFDHVGIDVMLSSVKSYTRKSENPVFYAPLISKMKELLDQNKLGIKNKFGFYDYSKAVESSPTNPDTNNDHGGYKKMVVKRLWDYYSKSVALTLESGVCTKEELGAYINDYLGTDNDPFILNN